MSSCNTARTFPTDAQPLPYDFCVSYPHVHSRLSHLIQPFLGSLFERPRSARFSVPLISSSSLISHLKHETAMTGLVTLSNVPHPSLYEHLLCVLVLSRHLDSPHGGTLSSATLVRSTVSPLHRHVVYMDGLQDYFLSHNSLCLRNSTRTVIL